MRNLIVTGTILRHHLIFIELLKFYNVKSVLRIHIHVLGKANLYLSMHFGDLIWHPLFTIATWIELKFITIGIW